MQPNQKSLNFMNHKNDLYLAEKISQLMKDISNDSDDDNYTIPKLMNYPMEIKDNSVKKRRLGIIKYLKQELNNLYKKNERILIKKLNQKTSIQNKYAFTGKYRKILIKGLEVNCRMITTNMNQNASPSSSTITSYNLSRIANIIFKGDFQNIIDELMEKCKEELQSKFSEDVNEIKSAAMYIPQHNESTCGWKHNMCFNIDKNIKKLKSYKSFFNNSNNDISNNSHDFFFDDFKPLCFYVRQLIGQELIPYVEDNNDDDDTHDDDNDECYISFKENEYIFDNLFFDKKELLGIKKIEINHTPNFLDTVNREDCTALISFSLDYIGVTNGRMNLYLKSLNDCPIYCTNVSSSNKLSNASNYLEEVLYNNKNVVEILEKKYKKKIPKCVKNFHQEQEEQQQQNNNKRIITDKETELKTTPKKSKHCSDDDDEYSDDDDDDNKNTDSYTTSDDDDDDDDDNAASAKYASAIKEISKNIS